jgi:hypothetical protein
MSSIFVDTIRKTGGTLGTDIRVKTTSVYESENSTGTTQNLVQGLAKAWWSSNDVTLKDSFNIGSLTDVAASTYDFNFTNAMANDDFAFPCATINTTANDVLLTTGVTTASVRQKGITANTAAVVDTQPCGAAIGDLA